MGAATFIAFVWGREGEGVLKHDLFVYGLRLFIPIDPHLTSWPLYCLSHHIETVVTLPPPLGKFDRLVFYYSGVGEGEWGVGSARRAAHEREKWIMSPKAIKLYAVWYCANYSSSWFNNHFHHLFVNGGTRRLSVYVCVSVCMPNQNESTMQDHMLLHERPYSTVTQFRKLLLASKM